MPNQRNSSIKVTEPRPKVLYQHSRPNNLNIRQYSPISPGQRMMPNSTTFVHGNQNSNYTDYNGFLRTNVDNGLFSPEINDGHCLSNYVQDNGDEFTTYGRKFTVKEHIVDPPFSQFIIDDSRNPDVLDELYRRIDKMDVQNQKVREQFKGLMDEIYRKRHSSTSHYANGETEEEIIEEIIEEEEILRKKPQIKLNQAMQEGTQSRTTGIGDYDLNRYHYIDILSPVIDRNAFPPDYWNRLQSTILERHLQSLPVKQDFSLQLQPATQNAATMCLSSQSLSQKHFGMYVKPAQADANIGTDSIKTYREVGCMAEESEERIRIWVQQRIRNHSQVSQEIMHDPVSLFRNNKEGFLEQISRISAPPTRSQEVDCRVHTASKECSTSNKEFTSNIGVGEENISTDYVKRPTESQSVLARAELLSKNILTDKIKTTDHGSITETPIVRSLGTHIRPITIQSYERGINTDGLEKLINASTNTDIIINSVQLQTPPELLDNYLKSSAFNQADKLAKQTRQDYLNSLVSKQVQSDFPPTTRDISAITDIALLDQLLDQLLKAREAKRVTINLQTTRTPTVDAAYSGSSYLPMTETSAGISHEFRDKSVEQTDPRTGKLILETWQSETDYGNASGYRRTHQTLTGPGGTIHVSHDGSLAPRLNQSSKIVSSDPSYIGSSSSFAKEYQGVSTISTNRAYSPRQNDLSRPFIMAGQSDGSVERMPSMKFRRSLRGDPTILDQNSINRTEASIIENSGIPPTVHERLRDPVMILSRSPTEHLESNIPTSDRDLVSGFKISEQMKKNCEIMARYFADGGNDVKMPEYVRQPFNQINNTWFDLTTCSPIEEDLLSDFMAILHQYSPKLLEIIVKSADIKGSTALHYAVGHGSWNVVTILIDTGYANVDHLNSSGYSPLMVAAIGPALTDEELKIVDRLFSQGDVNLRSRNDQRTPLILASSEGAVSIVGLLLSHNANVNIQDRVGNTALMCAIERGHVDVVRRLLMRPEIELTLKDNEGNDAISIAKESTYPRIFEMIERRNNDSALLTVSNGANISSSFQGDTLISKNSAQRFR